MNRYINNIENLKKELTDYEKQGVKLMLGNVPYEAESLVEKLMVCEPSSYMRDYVYENNILAELHFDDITKCLADKPRRPNRRKRNFQ